MRYARRLLFCSSKGLGATSALVRELLQLPLEGPAITFHGRTVDTPWTRGGPRSIAPSSHAENRPSVTEGASEHGISWRLIMERQLPQGDGCPRRLAPEYSCLLYTSPSP